MPTSDYAAYSFAAVAPCSVCWIRSRSIRRHHMRFQIDCISYLGTSRPRPVHLRGPAAPCPTLRAQSVPVPCPHDVH
jgi:hypothetical protein